MRTCLSLATVLLTLFHLTLGSTTQAARPGDRALYLEPDSTQRSMIAFYTDLYRDGKPMLITVDSALWAIQELHEQARARMETEVLTPRLSLILETLEKSLAASGEIPPQWIALDSEQIALPPPLQEPARRALLYVQTARLLLTGEAPPPSLQGEWNRIQAHETWGLSDVFEQQLDYADLKPRGQSLRTEPLKRYFLAARYLGNLVLRLDQLSARRNGHPFDQPAQEGGWFRGVDTTKAARRDREEMARLEAQYPTQGVVEMRAAALLSLILEKTHLTPDQTALDVWKELNGAETLWSGESPELDPPTLLTSLESQLEGPVSFSRTLELLADDYETLVWLAWIEARLPALPYCQETPLGRRGFSLLGRRFPTDHRVLRAMRANDIWNGEGNKVPDNAFTRLSGDSGKTQRGLSRGLDLLAVMGNSQAYRILKREGDLQYFGMDRQKHLAEEVWKSARPKEKEKLEELKEWWISPSLRTNKLQNSESITSRLLRSVEQTAGAMQLRKNPDYVRQPDHEFLRANSALAFWVLLQRESEETESLHTLDPTPSTSTLNIENPTPNATLPCYVDPYPTLYADLAQVANQMVTVLQMVHHTEDPFVKNAQAVQRLLKTLERAALSQAKRSGSPSPEDQKILQDWGGALARARTLPPDDAVGIGFRLEEPLPTLATLQKREGFVLQVGVGPLWSLTTTAPIEGYDIQVTGALLSYYEVKRSESQTYTATQWRELHRKQEPIAPTLLRECSTFQRLLPRFPQFFEASYQAGFHIPPLQKPRQTTPSDTLDTSSISLPAF